MPAFMAQPHCPNQQTLSNLEAVSYEEARPWLGIEGSLPMLTHPLVGKYPGGCNQGVPTGIMLSL